MSPRFPVSFRAWLLAASVALVPALSPASAQELVDATDPQALTELARGFGSSNLETSSNGDPMIRGRINGIGYAIFFFGCTDNQDCKSLNFYAGWDVDGISLETINTWNAQNRFSKAYLDAEQQPVIEFDVSLDGGVSRANFEDVIDWWRIAMEQFKSKVIDASQ